MQTIKIRNLDSTEDNTITDNSYLALALNENDVKRGSEDPNDLNPRITVKTTISQLRKAILPTIGSSPPVSENEEGGIDVGIGEVILDENGDALVPQPPVVIKQGGKDQIKITDDGISLKENVIIDKTLSVTGPTTFNNTTTFNRDVFFNELTNDPSPTEGKIYRKSDGLYFNGSKILTEGEGGKWVDGDSSGDIVYNGGNVGIGTSSPDYALHVEGGGYFSGESIVNIQPNEGVYLGESQSSPDVHVSIISPASKASYIDFSDTSRDAIGRILYSNPSATLTQGMHFFSDFTGNINDADMFIDPNGNVGIGTINPTAPLDIDNDVSGFDVDGHMVIQNSPGATDGDCQGIGFSCHSNINDGNIKNWFGTIHTGTYGKSDFIFLSNNESNNNAARISDEVMRIDSAGKVTIGASLGVGITPQEKFHVNGTVMLDDTSAPTTKTNKLYSVSSVLYWGGNKILTGAGASSGSGGVTIADISGLETALANKLDKPTAGSEPTFVDSDINLKTNISLIQSPIKSLESIRGVNFEWKEESNKSGEDQGLIAQEVEKIIPSAVKKGEDGYLKVDYTKLVPFLLEAVKDLSERVKELEKD